MFFFSKISTTMNQKMQKLRFETYTCDRKLFTKTTQDGKASIYKLKGQKGHVKTARVPKKSNLSKKKKKRKEKKGTLV